MKRLQIAVRSWLLKVFNTKTIRDPLIRTDRFLEEAFELAQAIGYPAERANQILDYVYSRHKGDLQQEIGGTVLTLAALANSLALDLEEEGYRELTRINHPEIIQKIQEREAIKLNGYKSPET